MSEKLTKEIFLYRQKAAELIKCVLAKRMPVKQALLAFPKDVHDESVRASWHALCHYEADEELRKNNPEYKEEQDLFLEDIANTLNRGDELPEYVISAYKKYYDAPLNPHRQGLLGFLSGFESFLNTKKID
ncbi:MAG: hypothetical protein K6C94_02935 [Candidatus Gastranaerophilales bacterium]|nr:hypothetical protein [Candidatus Gastranaerophilales bacterium]